MRNAWTNDDASLLQIINYLSKQRDHQSQENCGLTITVLRPCLAGSVVLLKGEPHNLQKTVGAANFLRPHDQQLSRYQKVAHHGSTSLQKLQRLSLLFVRLRRHYLEHHTQINPRKLLLKKQPVHTSPADLSIRLTELNF